MQHTRDTVTDRPSEPTAREVIAKALPSESMAAYFGFNEGVELEAADDILSALKQAGYVVVPVEPGKKVLSAMAASATIWLYEANKAYRAMLAAAKEG